MLMFGRNQHNSVKQLSFNEKINKFKKILNGCNKNNKLLVKVNRNILLEGMSNGHALMVSMVHGLNGPMVSAILRKFSIFSNS